MQSPEGPKRGLSILLRVESGGTGPRVGFSALAPRLSPRPGPVDISRAALWPQGPEAEPAPLHCRSTPATSAWGLLSGSSVPEEISPATREGLPLGLGGVGSVFPLLLYLLSSGSDCGKVN